MRRGITIALGLPFASLPFQPTTSPSSALQNLAPVGKSLRWRSAFAPLNTLLEDCDSATALFWWGRARRSADSSPVPHAHEVGLQRLIVNPTRSETAAGVRQSTRQL